jgi:hypothetical protein
MTTDAVPAAGDPRRLLSDVRTLADRVRRDQRVTWVALLVLATVTFVAILFDWYFLKTDCQPVADGVVCHVRRVLWYWPPALLLAYAAIALCYVRVARARGLGARVWPYALTGVALTVLTLAAWEVMRLYFDSHPMPTEPFPYWFMFVDRLVAPWGTIGIALLVLARLERNVPLLVFTLGYLAVVLVPINTIWRPNWQLGWDFLAPQVINGAVLLLGAVGFALARRWPRAPQVINGVLLFLTAVGFVLVLRWHRW